MTPLRLVYEDMVGDPIGTVAEVGKHVGVDLERLDETPSSRLQVQRDEVSEEWASRLRERFSGSDL